MEQLSDTGEELPFTLHILSYSGPNGAMAEKEWLIKSDVSRRAACGRSPTDIVGSNPTGGMDICLL